MHRPPKVEEVDPPPKPSIQPLQRDYYPSPTGSSGVLHNSWTQSSASPSTKPSNSNLPPLASILGPPRPQSIPSFSPTVSHSSASASASSQPPAFGGTVGHFLERLALTEYVEVLVKEGFDRLECLQDIQEEDMAALGIKRGHRRLIQRELATLRGVAQSTPLTIFPPSAPEAEDDSAPSLTHKTAAPVQQINRNVVNLAGNFHPNPEPTPPRPKPIAPASGASAHAPPGPATAAAGSPPPQANHPNPSKRRYRRHPKADPNAPMKPVSAFVAFSSQLRNEEEYKNESFATMSRLVGERWQSLPRATKDRLESRAAEAKEAYAADLAAYRLTPEFAEHAAYLRDFKIKNGFPPDEPLSVASPTTSVPSEATKAKSRRRAYGVDEPPSPRTDRLKRERVEEEDEVDFEDQLEREEEDDQMMAERDQDNWEEQAAAARVLSRGRTPATGQMPPPID